MRGKKRKICVITSSRADYGYLSWLMREIKRDKSLQLQVIATGAHLSRRHGKTHHFIDCDGFKIDEKIDILKYPDSETGIIKAIGLGCILFADAFKKLKPDIVVVLGDRYEIFSAATAAHVAKIPIAHLHGGESTEGAIDEAMRHAITKMSSIHFAAAEQYRKRIIQLGENPKCVFNFGAPSLEAPHHLKLLGKKELEQSLRFKLNGTVCLFTYHPVTLEKELPQKHVDNILRAIKGFHFKVIFTQSNADPHGQLINRAIRRFCRQHPERYKFIDNLGQIRYFSCLKHFNLMVGNSSSGIIEAPSFGIPVVNVGDRQKGRVRAKNVIDCGYTTAEIKRAIKTALSPVFRRHLKNIRNPYVKYRDGKIAHRIKEKLKMLHISEGLLKKQFFDISSSKGAGR